MFRPESKPVRRLAPVTLAACALLAFTAAIATPSAAEHGLAMHGKPALPPDFRHMPYANPDAPKGGQLRWGVLGTFDSLNPMIVRGIAVPQIRGFVLESLMARGSDEPFTLYGLLAESLETDDIRSFVSFRINPAAKFADGRPVTTDDVLFSWSLLRERGRPNHRLYYSKVAKATATDERTVRFDFVDTSDRELPLILGLMPILPKHATNPATFEETSFTSPLGSGPYRVTSVNPGNSVTLTRNPDYWGRDLPVNKGVWNFEEIRFDYYREANSFFEAFKRGLYDFRVENEPLRWHDGYDFPAAQRGEVVRETLKPGVPHPADFLVFNTRRPIFADVRVREALTLLLDFDWINKNYFFDLYERSGSYFPGSELSAYGRAASDKEKALLAPHAEAVRADVMEGRYALPAGDPSGRDREALRRALALLRDAGYDLTNNVLRKRDGGAPFQFEIMVTTRDQERIALAFARDLKRAGITIDVRMLDAVQYEQRRLAWDFDMIQNRWDQSLSPGNEQYFYFGIKAADAQGSRNYMGARNPAVDAMIGALLEARERTDFVSAVRALDRVLISGFYSIPLHNVPAQWIARWPTVERPEKTPLSGYLAETWWRTEAKDKPRAP